MKGQPIAEQGSPGAKISFSGGMVGLSGQLNHKTRLTFLLQAIAGATAEMNSADDPEQVFKAYQHLISLVAEQKRVALEVGLEEVTVPVQDIPPANRYQLKI